MVKVVFMACLRQRDASSFEGVLKKRETFFERKKGVPAPKNGFFGPASPRRRVRSGNLGDPEKKPGRLDACQQ
jgi:hypothetical protein